MISAGIETASLLPIMVRFILLMRPVLSSGSDSSSDSDVPVSTKMLEELPGTINLEELDLDPKHLNVDAPSHHNPPEDADVHKANTFTCTKCENIDADECILTKLGREICQLVAKDKHEKASEHFVEYLKHLDNHEEIPPSLPGDGIEVSWKSLKKFIMIFIRSQYSTNVLVHLLTKFIGTFIMSQNEDKDNTNILVQVLKKYKNLPPFRLNNIVVSEADFLVHRIPDKSEETENKIKLEDCILWGISKLYDRGRCMECRSTTEEMKTIAKTYNDTLVAVLFYSMNIQKLEASEQKCYLCCDFAKRIEALKIADFMQLFIKEFIPVSELEYTDLTPYKGDKSLFEAFKIVVQRVIDGKSTMINTANLLSWCSTLYRNNMIDKALDQNFKVSFKNLVESVRSMNYEPQSSYALNLEKLLWSTNSIFPFKLKNIMVSCSDFSKAEGPLFGKVRGANRRNAGHKKLSKCSLLEFQFLCQLYKLDEKVDDRSAAENMIKDLFWQGINEGNIPSAGVDKFVDRSAFKEMGEKLESRKIRTLFERNLISFIEFFQVLENRENTYNAIEPLRKELDNAIDRGEELKLWKELAAYGPKTEFFEKDYWYVSGLSDLAKLLEVCSKYKDVMDLLSRILFEIQRVLYLKLENIDIDEKDRLRGENQKCFVDPVVCADGSGKIGKPRKYITDCNFQEIVIIFNTYKSDKNEEVNKLFAYILLCAVDMEKSLEEDISHELPESFFAYAHKLPSERLAKLVEAGIVPAKLSSNPPA